MARLIEYDVSGVEASGGGTGVKVPIGLRVCRIARADPRDKKRDGTPANDIEVALDFGPEYDWLFTYVGLNPESAWKLAEFIRACGLKDKGKFDPGKQVGKVLRCKVNPGEYQGAPRPEAGRLFPAQPGDEVGSASEVSQKPFAEYDSDGDGDGDAATAVAAAVTGDHDFTASRETDEDVGSYDDWEDSDLEAEVSDRDLTIPGGRGAKRGKLIASLRADDEDAEAGTGKYAEGEEDVSSGNGAVGDNDDYSDWDLTRLKEEWEARDMGDLPVVRGRNAAERVTALMAAKLQADDSENPFN